MITILGQFKGFKGDRMKKGFALSMQQVFNVLTIIGLIIVAVYVFKASHFDMNVLVDGFENQRRLISLGNILISPPQLVAVEDGRNIRGVIDSSKLATLDRDTLYQEILYPDTKYEFKINDIVDGATVGGIRAGSVEDYDVYEMRFPLAIKYSDDKINPGIMELKFYVKKTT